MNAPLRTWTRLAIVLLGLAIGTTAQATVVRPIDIETLSRRAHLIAQATAESSSSSWVDGTIRTVTRIRIDSVIKGEAPRWIEVPTRGGTVDGLTQQVSGGPRFTLGEPVIVFLRKSSRRTGRYVLEGFSQGKFDLVRGTKGERLVTRRDEGLLVMEKDGQVHPSEGIAPMPEEEFVARVKRALRTGSAP